MQPPDRRHWKLFGPLTRRASSQYDEHVNCYAPEKEWSGLKLQPRLNVEAYDMNGRVVRLLSRRNFSCAEPLQGCHASRTKRILSGHTSMDIRKLSKAMTLIPRLMKGEGRIHIFSCHPQLSASLASLVSAILFLNPMILTIQNCTSDPIAT